MVETIKRPFRGKKLPNKNKNCLLLHPLDLVKAKLLQPLKGYKSQIHFFFNFLNGLKFLCVFLPKMAKKVAILAKNDSFLEIVIT